MTDEDAIIYASNLVMLYRDMVKETAGYAHDPAAHNLCSAVVSGYSSLGRTRPDFEKHFYSYSAPKSLPGWIQQRFAPMLIPPNNPNGALFGGGSMAYLHTEVRLLNFLWANRMDRQVLPAAGQIMFFSTRSVCGGCANFIGEAQRSFSTISIALIPFELQAEAYGGNADEATRLFAFCAERYTEGKKRAGSTEVVTYR